MKIINNKNFQLIILEDGRKHIFYKGKIPRKLKKKIKNKKCYFIDLENKQKLINNLKLYENLVDKKIEEMTALENIIYNRYCENIIESYLFDCEITQNYYYILKNN